MLTTALQISIIPLKSSSSILTLTESIILTFAGCLGKNKQAFQQNADLFRREWILRDQLSNQFLYSKAIRFIYSQEKRNKMFDFSNAISAQLHLISRSIVKVFQAELKDTLVYSEELQVTIYFFLESIQSHIFRSIQW